MPVAARPESLAGWYQRRRRTEEKPHAGRESFAAYIRHVSPGYEFPRHLLDLIAILEAVERSEEDRVMVIMPPRHGKSRTCSQLFPGWFLGRNPQAEMIHAANVGRLAQSFGRRTRNLMLSAAHLDVFPGSGLSRDNRAADLMHTEQDGVYVSAGVGSAIAGRGADLLLIDDPIKTREEADSEVMRERAWDWYLYDAYSRLHPGGRVVLVCTRWHDDDLAGRLLEAQASGEGDRWTVVHYKAISEDNEPLWPEKRSLAFLERIRKNLMLRNARAWFTLYQGEPSPAEGTYFKKPWFHYGVPGHYGLMKIYGASDLATTKKQSSDWSVHVVVGVDEAERLWLLDLWRDKVSSDGWVPPWIDFARRYQPILWVGERIHLESTVGPWIDREFAREKVYLRRELLSSHQDKEAKALSLQAWMSARGLWMSRAAPWASIVENELLRFPTGKHDDIVDALALIGRLMAIMRIGEVPMPAPPEDRDAVVSFDELLKGKGAGMAAGSRWERS